MTFMSLLLIAPPRLHLISWALPEFGGGGEVMKFSKVLLHPLLRGDCGQT